jgi:hypothetical protein
MDQGGILENCSDRCSPSVLCRSRCGNRRCGVPHAQHAGRRPAAVGLVRAAVVAQGGEQALRAVRSVRFEAVGYRNMVEQSERPEGPYATEFDRIAELHDLAGNRLRRTLRFEVPPFPETVDTQVFAGGVGMRDFGGNKGAASALLVQQMRESLALSPERLLLTALETKDLRLEPSTTLHGIAHRVVAFTLDGATVRIYLNSNTMLPTAFDTSSAIAHSGYWSYLGDVTCEPGIAPGLYKRVGPIIRCSGTSSAMACRIG